MTVDLHAGQTTGSTLLPWDDLPSSYEYLPRILEWGLNDMVFASPDAGRAKLNEILAAKVEVPIATILKQRDTSKMNESEAKGILGDVRNKNVVLIDDMFDTCGSIINAAKIIMEEGAMSVYAAAGHGVFSGKAFERLRSGPFKKILVTNTIQQEIPEDLQDLIEVVDISGMLSKAIWYNMIGKSLSEEFY